MKPPPTTDIFYVTYRNDANWFRYSLAILRKNLTGWRKIVVVAPEQDRTIFDEITAGQSDITVHYIPDWPGRGYHWQQFCKLSADQYSDATYIGHMDSDVYIKEPTAIGDFFFNDKPGWLWAYYGDVRADDAGVWRKPTERAFGGPVEREFMEGFMFIFKRELYALCRQHIQRVHGVPCRAYIEAAANDGNVSFSEFNFMGAVAYVHAHDDYHWVDRNREPWPAGFHRTRQFWSHAKFEDCLPEIRQMLDGGNDHRIRVTNRGIWVLSNDTHISRWVEQENRLDHDVPTLQRLCRYIKPGDTVVDVGAFIGDHTIAYARATHGAPGGRVLAFEPNAPAFECLKRNLAGFGHVECINAGLSDEPGEMAVAVDPNAGASHLKAGVGVQIRTLDSMDLDRLDFLKIDAEGMELRILAGAERTIVACRPVLYIEINRGALERAGASASAVLQWLGDHGYQVTGVEDGPQFDVLCVPAGRDQATPVVLVLGVSHREVHLGRLWLRWVSHLCRQPDGDNRHNQLVIFVNRRTTQEQRAQLLREVGDTKDGMFQTVIAEPPDEQERGYPGSASHLFVRALEHVGQRHPGAATLWCEADTVAVRPSWFREIVDEYQACGLPFMGGQAGLGEFRHMTGNAVYPPDWRTLAPLLLDSFTASDSAYWGEGKGEPWDVFARSQVMPRMHLCRTIQQIWRPARFTGLGQILPATALFHQCKDGSLVRVLAGRYPGFTPPVPVHGFTMLNRYTAVEVAGLSFPFAPCQYVTGLGYASALEPADCYQELELHLLAARSCGIEAVTPAEARQMLAGTARSRLPIPPVNTLRF